MEEQSWIDKATAEHLVHLSRQRDEMLRQGTIESRVGLGKSMTIHKALGLEPEKQNGRRSAMINHYSGRNDDFHEQTKEIMKYYEATNMIPQNPCVEIYFGTGGDCVLGQDSDYIMRLFEPNKLLLIC